MTQQSVAWTVERVDLLTVMRTVAPVTLTEVLNQLEGPHLTRCAVIGKRDRMFGVRKPKKSPEERATAIVAARDQENMLARARRAAKREGISYNHEQVLAEHKSNIRAPSIDPAGSTPRHISLAELTDHTCKWPYGDGDPSTFTFCGAPPKQEGKPYCRQHAALAYQPLPTRGKPYLVLGNTRGGVFRRSA